MVTKSELLVCYLNLSLGRPLFEKVSGSLVRQMRPGEMAENTLSCSTEIVQNSVQSDHDRGDRLREKQTQSVGKSFVWIDKIAAGTL